MQITKETNISPRFILVKKKIQQYNKKKISKEKTPHCTDLRERGKEEQERKGRRMRMDKKR